MEELQSKTIYFLRFPLIVGVVLIHAKITDQIRIHGVPMLSMQQEPFALYRVVSSLLSDVMASVAVPLFFFLSGFLFFYRTSGFSRSVYKEKLQKRVSSLLIPYLCWNLAVILLLLLSQSFFPHFLSGANRSVAEYSFSDGLAAFWNITPEGFPVCFQLWFLRDLMVVMLLSPLIYAMVRYLRWWGVCALSIAWFGGWWFRADGFSLTALCFFSLGAYFSVWRLNFVAWFRPLLLPLLVLYGVLAFLCVYDREQAWWEYAHSLSVFVGMACALSLTACGLERGWWRVNRFLCRAAFFVYAFHALPLRFFLKWGLAQLPVQNSFSLLGLYLSSALVVLLLSLGVYALLQRFLPRFTGVITGGR